MRRIFVLLLLLPLAIMTSFAQTQQGYVKTKGRLSSNGTVISGTRITGATVTVQGSNAVVSGNNGTFSLAIPSKNYYLQNVQKQGYVLTDPDVLSKQYAYSKNPLVLVLETQDQQANDKIAAERRIRRTLQRQLQEKEDEIESLKEQKKLSDEEYRKQLQEVYAQQKNNERLISDMADRYSRMDFDEVDEFNRRISQLILDGRLTEADSLLNTKGDINARVAVLRQHQEANAQAEQELKKKQKKLEKSKVLTQKEMEDLAQDCYSKFEIFKMLHQNDSAAYYIELRAEMDTANIEWGLVAGKYCQQYKALLSKAEFYYERSLRNAMTQTNDLPKCYNAMASLSSDRGEYDKALMYYQKSYDIVLANNNGENHKSIIVALMNLCNMYRKMGDFKRAIEISERAVKNMYNTDDFSTSGKVKVYGNIANLYSSQNQYRKALEYFFKANELLEICEENLPLEKITTHINIGHTYFELGEYDSAMDWDMKAYDLVNNILGDSHPDMATILNNIGSVYLKQNRPEKTLEYMKKSLGIDINVYGHKSPNLIIDYNNIGMVQHTMEQYEEALTSYNISLDLCKKHIPSNHPLFATLYNNIGSTYFKMGNEDTVAMSYFEKALKLRIERFGEKNSSVAMVYQNIGGVYQRKGDARQAIYYFEKAKTIFGETLGTDNPRTKAVERLIEEMKAKTN